MVFMHFFSVHCSSQLSILLLFPSSLPCPRVGYIPLLDALLQKFKVMHGLSRRSLAKSGHIRWADTFKFAFFSHGHCIFMSSSPLKGVSLLSLNLAVPSLPTREMVNIFPSRISFSGPDAFLQKRRTLSSLLPDAFA